MLNDKRVYLLVLLLSLQNSSPVSNLIPAGNWMHVWGYVRISILKVTFIFSLLSITNPKHYKWNKIGSPTLRLLQSRILKSARKAPGQPDLIVHTVTLLERDLHRVWLVHPPRWSFRC